nr:hypothetical protein [Tanacetum cinerariifolium]
MSFTFADTHNIVAYLNKSDASEGFNQVNDFLNGSYIQYALTVNPTIYGSCIKQFWNTVAVKQSNDVTRLQALVDRKKVVITEAAIRDALRLDVADGVGCLPNEEIFAELARMGYEKTSTKLTFYKAFFSSQWKFLIHTILQSMSAKRTSWNEFSSAMASAVDGRDGRDGRIRKSPSYSLPPINRSKLLIILRVLSILSMDWIIATALSLSPFLQIVCGRYCILIPFRRSSRALQTSLSIPSLNL